jgi:hypothetical protein
MAKEKKLPDTKKVSLTTRPVEVRVESGGDIFFVKIWKNGSLQIRPKGARKAESVALTTVSSIYQRALLVAAQAARPKRKKTVSRNLLATERRGI